MRCSLGYKGQDTDTEEPSGGQPLSRKQHTLGARPNRITRDDSVTSRLLTTTTFKLDTCTNATSEEGALLTAVDAAGACKG